MKTINRRTFIRNAVVATVAAPAIPAAIARATELAPDMMVAYWFCTPMTYHYTPEYLAVVEKIFADTHRQMSIPNWFFNERKL